MVIDIFRTWQLKDPPGFVEVFGSLATPTRACLVLTEAGYHKGCLSHCGRWRFLGYVGMCTRVMNRGDEVKSASDEQTWALLVLECRCVCLCLEW